MYIELLFEFGLGLVNDLSLYIFGLTCGSRHTKWISNDVLCVLQPAARVQSVFSHLLSLLSAKKGENKMKNIGSNLSTELYQKGNPRIF